MLFFLALGLLSMPISNRVEPQFFIRVCPFIPPSSSASTSSTNLEMLRNNTVIRRQFSSCLPRLQKLHNTPEVIAEKVEGSDDVKLKIKPLKRQNEDLKTKRARLTYQSRKRGILETDLLLSRFSKKYLDSFTEAELDEYDKLLDELDWDIYYWATKNYAITPLPDKWKDSKILKQLQEFSENKEKVIMRMPSL